MLIYQHQPDEAITWRKTPGDEDSDWWAGVQKCGATLALAASLALTGAHTAQAISVSHQPQDEAASQPVVPIQNEDFWQNPAAQVQARIWQPLPYSFDAAEFTSTFDEDYWQNAVRPVIASLAWPQPFWDQNDFIGYTLDEDYWIQPLPNRAATLLWQPPQDVEIVPQPAVPFIPDEDYWQAPFQVASAVSLRPSNFLDSGEGSFSFVPPVSGKAHYIPVWRRRRR